MGPFLPPLDPLMISSNPLFTPLDPQRRQDLKLTNVLGDDAELRRPLPLHTLLPGGIVRDTVADNSGYSYTVLPQPTLFSDAG
jgi:hypothetical protein